MNWTTNGSAYENLTLLEDDDLLTLDTPRLTLTLSAGATPECNITLWNAKMLDAYEGPPTVADFTNRVFYNWMTPILVLGFGIPGDILNLITLSSPNLQAVPFMYIRAIAVADLFGLTCVATFCTRFVWQRYIGYWLAFYRAHMELVILNAAFTSSLYIAVILTLERYLMVCKPTRRFNSSNPRFAATRNIAIAVFVACSLHIPLAWQWMVYPVMSRNSSEIIDYRARDSELVNCHQKYGSIPDIYGYYKIAREIVRLASIVVILGLNIVITRHLQLVKARRRRMTLKPSGVSSLNGATAKSVKRRSSNLINSFTEKRLAGMMLGITFIYFIGNAPQSVVMLINSDQRKKDFSYAVFRNVANFMEVLNHCLNFYVFCITSRDYSATFVANSRCLSAFLRGCCHLSIRRPSIPETESASCRADDSPTAVTAPPPRENSFLLREDGDLVYL